MVKTLIKVDLEKAIKDQIGFHNRWHPDIPPLKEKVKPGQIFRVECFDANGGQVKNDDTVSDLLENVDFSSGHPLSGPIEIEGAEPGDLLEVELLDIQPLEGHEWGYTAILPPDMGGSFICDIFDQPKKAIWDFHGIYATSRHVPGVKIAGIPHPGVIGTAPSRELLIEWNQREKELIDENPNAIPPLAFPPLEKNANLGGLKGHPDEEKMKSEATRTVPPRENGGNCDIKNLSKGSKIWLPVYIPGANLSIGDLHFSQGDGEITLCGAIEMCGAVTLRTKLIKNGVQLYSAKNPIFMPGPVEPLYTKYLTFCGISIDGDGKQLATCPKFSFRNAILNAVEYFQKFGYSAEQIYLLLSACPCEGRISSITSPPNAHCSIGIPVEIFDFDVLPKKLGHLSAPKGQLAPCKNILYHT